MVTPPTFPPHNLNLQQDLRGQLDNKKLFVIIKRVSRATLLLLDLDQLRIVFPPTTFPYLST